MTRATDRITPEVPVTPRSVSAAEPRGRLLKFPVGRKGRRLGVGAFEAARLAKPEARQEPRDRFLRAIEMEQRGFAEGAIAHLRTLLGEVTPETDPYLAVNVRYFLGSFLMLRGETAEALDLTEEGILLAWEHGAPEELELLENLSQQLGG